MEQKDTYYNYDVDKLELSLPYVDGNGNVCTVSALYNVDHNILKQNFKENENDNNPVILSYILHVTDNTYNVHDIEYKLKFKKYPQTVLFTDDIDNIKIYNNVNAVINCFSTYCVENNEIKTHIPTIYNFLDNNEKIITPPKSLYTQIDNVFSLPEYINGKKVSYTYLLNLNHIKLPFTYTVNNIQQTTYDTTLLLGPTSVNTKNYSFTPYDNIDERFLKKIKVEKINEPLNFSIIPTNYHENKLYSYALKNGSNVCNINNLFKFKINNSYIYLSSYFSCENYQLQKNDSDTDNSYIIVPGFITKFTKNYLSKKYVIYEYNDNSYITQNLQHIQTNNNKIYKYCLQYNNDSNQCVYAYSSTSYSLPKLITDNNIYYEYEYDNTYNTYTYYNTYISNFKIDNAYSINNIKLHYKNGLYNFATNSSYISYTYSYIRDNILNITYQNEDTYTYLLNTKLCIVNYNSDNTPIYSIYYNDINNNDENNKEILKNLLLDCFRIYVHYDNSIVLKNITNIFNIKYTYSISELELEQQTENYWDSLDINSYKFERLYEDEFLNILATKETFNKQFSLTLYDCCIISVSLNTNKNIVSDIYIVIYNILGLPNQYKIINDTNTEESNTEESNTYIDRIENNIIYIKYSELLRLLEDKKIAGTIIKFNGVSSNNCEKISETHKITYKNKFGMVIDLSESDTEYDKYKTKLYAYFNNTLSYMCNVNIEDRWNENTIYTNGFNNLIYENFYDVKTTRNINNFNIEKTKLTKFLAEFKDVSFTYNGESYINRFTYFTWNNENIFLSIKSTYGGYKDNKFPNEISNGEINNKNFYVEEYTFDYSYIDNNKVTYNYAYTCLYKCNGFGFTNDISMDIYAGNNIVINPVFYEKSSNLTKGKFYKKYVIDDDNTTLSTINTFNYKERIQEQFYRVYLNKLKYNDSIEYILPTNNSLLEELYKTNKIIEFKQIIDNYNYTDPGEIIGEFNEDFIKITLSGLSINLNRIYNIITINNGNYISNAKMLFKLNNADKYEIKLNKNYKLNTVILLYKYTYTYTKIINGIETKITNEIYFYYINNKFYVVAENLSNIDIITVSYVDDGDEIFMRFNKIAETDNIITGLYEINPVRPNYRPPFPPTIVRYFINNPIPSINDNVILLDIEDDNNINENWGKITDITYWQTKNIDIVPLLYNEYDNGLSDVDKQLLIDTIEFLNNYNNWDDGPIE